MKLHRQLVEAVIIALTDIFKKNLYADKVVEYTLRSNSKWGARDRAFIAETIYNCVRHLRLYSYLRKKDAAFNISDLKRRDFEEIPGVDLILRGFDTTNFPEFIRLNPASIKANLDEVGTQSVASQTSVASLSPATRHSIPDWLQAQGENEMGVEVFEKEMTALNRQADVVIRCNTLKISVPDLQKKLSDIGWQSYTTVLTPEALVLEKRGNITGSELFKTGLFEVQDAGSQLIAPFLKVEPGMFVIDACAGAGGKSLHLATLMHDSGKILAMDTEVKKLEELNKRAARNGIKCIQTLDIAAWAVEKTKSKNANYQLADRLLLDVPCSGLGVLRRNPDTKWKLSAKFLEEIKIVQQKILQDYSKMLKPDGKLVYATCSILPSENQEQIKTFLKNNPTFKLEEERIVSPDQAGFDGFYMARLTTNN